MPTDGVYVRPSGQKTFIPLENNPDVFTSLAHDLGVSSDLGFYDVYSLDDPGLLSLVPRPVSALIVTIPAPMYFAVRAEDGISVPLTNLTYDKCADQEPVMWFQQTIGHACGLISLLHALSNGEVREFIQKDSFLDGLLKQVTPLQAVARAEALYNSQELEKLHMRAARRGNSVAPGADEENYNHFITFIKGKDGHLWELEGSTDGPVDRGALGEDEDVLSEKALEQGVKRFLKFADGNLNFSVVAVARKPSE